MKGKLLLFLLVNNFSIILAQEISSKNTDGKYIALFEEKGPVGPTKSKVIQLAENNGVQMLAVAACEKCFPVIYTFKPKESAQYGKPVFYNSMGFFAIAYDKESFVVFIPSIQGEEDFSFINFYSKNPATTRSMSKEKIAKYAIDVLDYL